MLLEEAIAKITVRALVLARQANLEFPRADSAPDPYMIVFKSDSCTGTATLIQASGRLLLGYGDTYPKVVDPAGHLDEQVVEATARTILEFMRRPAI